MFLVWVRLLITRLRHKLSEVSGENRHRGVDTLPKHIIQDATGLEYIVNTHGKRDISWIKHSIVYVQSPPKKPFKLDNI